METLIEWLTVAFVIGIIAVGAYYPAMTMTLIHKIEKEDEDGRKRKE